jgi:adenine-specific DNA-methyltransferase
MTETKKIGQYFTPEHVADFMVSLASVSKQAKILEPACGEGVFLKILNDRGYKNTVGYEIDKSLELNTESKVIFESFVGAEIKDKYDLVIGNPPYIRWKNLDKDLKTELESNILWKKYFNSLCDYLYIFILKSVEYLKDGGELIFITPEYWINTSHSEVLRDYLVQNGYFTDIIHFNEMPIFSKVASSIVIFKYIKKTNNTDTSKNVRVVKFNSSRKFNIETLTDILRKNDNKEFQSFERNQFKVGERWVLATNNLQNRLAVFEKKCLPPLSKTLFRGQENYITLGDIADIGNGMVSGLDKAFQLPKDIKLTEREKKASIRVLKAKNMERYIHGEISTYIFLNGDVKTENDLKEKYPNFYQWLLQYKEDLNKRYNYSRDIKYWQWVFLRSFKLFDKQSERIFIPCKERISHKNYFRFSYVNQGIFPTQDVTAVFPKENVKESIYYLLALLNSDYVFEWLKHKGIVKGNIVEFSEKPLSSIPIRLIDWSDENEVKTHNEISNLCQEYIMTKNSVLLPQLNSRVNALF